MDETIVLINFNEYQGGGETLLIRFAEYLRDNSKNYIIICSKNSFIHSELILRNFPLDKYYCSVKNYNTVYITKVKRDLFIEDLATILVSTYKVCLVSFCMRDLYTTFLLSRKLFHATITHLVLHIQDDLFLGQTLIDKLTYFTLRSRKFSNQRNIECNRMALSTINNNGGLISMAEIINSYWFKKFQIRIPTENIVPLPSFKVVPEIEYQKLNNKKIIWIGRIVDFKIPAIIAMIEFVSNNEEYSLTIVGDGGRKVILDYICVNSLSVSRVKFVGEVSYNELGEVIKGHSIGYAMGTSLIELAMYKIPVIVALASYDHSLLSNSICGGIFYNKPRGCDGSDLMVFDQQEISFTIPEVLRQIDKEYIELSKFCYEYAKNGYSENVNFQLYLDIIKRNKILSKNQSIEIPSLTIIRKLFFNFMSYFKIQ